MNIGVMNIYQYGRREIGNKSGRPDNEGSEYSKKGGEIMKNQAQKGE